MRTRMLNERNEAMDHCAMNLTMMMLKHSKHSFSQSERKPRTPKCFAYIRFACLLKRAEADFCTLDGAISLFITLMGVGSARLPVAFSYPSSSFVKVVSARRC